MWCGEHTQLSYVCTCLDRCSFWPQRKVGSSRLLHTPFTLSGSSADLLGTGTAQSRCQQQRLQSRPGGTLVQEICGACRILQDGQWRWKEKSVLLKTAICTHGWNFWIGMETSVLQLGMTLKDRLSVIVVDITSRTLVYVKSAWKTTTNIIVWFQAATSVMNVSKKLSKNWRKENR